MNKKQSYRYQVINGPDLWFQTDSLLEAWLKYDELGGSDIVDLDRCGCSECEGNCLSIDEIGEAGDKVNSLAQAAFIAYNDFGPTPWKTFDGRDVPKWDELSTAVQNKWRAAAVAIIKP